MKSKCNNCGTCCKAIPYFGDLKKVNLYEPDKTIVADYFETISKEQALLVNQRVLDFINDEDEVTFYRCKLVTSDNKCPIHGTALHPNMCKNFPLYGKEPTDNNAMAKNCGWRMWMKKEGFIVIE